MPRKTITFDDFSGGDWGIVEAWNAPKNSFSATNMIVTQTGELCVRPGMKKTNPTGLANGVVWGLGQKAEGSNEVWFGQGTAVREFNPTSVPADALSTASGALTGTPTGLLSVYLIGQSVYLGTSAGVYLYNSGSNAVSSLLAGVDAGPGIAQYGDRLVIVNETVDNTEIRYSAAADFTSWPAANVLPIGGANGIAALLPQRNHLLILKADEGIYMITGALGVNETLRRVAQSVTVANQHSAAVTLNQDVWFVIGRIGVPTRFDGANIHPASHITLPRAVTAEAIVVAPTVFEDRNGLIAYTQMTGGTPQVWLYHLGVWTKHSFGVDFEPFCASLATSHRVIADNDGARALSSGFVFTDGGAAGATPNFYTWVPTIDRPGSETETTGLAPERAGDDSASQVEGSVTFPEWHSEDGSEVTVRQVIVDFRSWNTGGSATNHFSMYVNGLRRYDTTSPQASTAVEFDQAGSSSATSGTIQRRVYNFGDQGPAGGFQLVFTAIRGLAIQRIHVVVDVEPPRW